MRTAQRGPGEEVRRIVATAPQDDAVIKALREWRDDAARRSRLAANGILTDRQIRQIAADLPNDIAGLAESTDMVFATRHGESILAALATVKR